MSQAIDNGFKADIEKLESKENTFYEPISALRFLCSCALVGLRMLDEVRLELKSIRQDGIQVSTE